MAFNIKQLEGIVNQYMLSKLTDNIFMSNFQAFWLGKQYDVGDKIPEWMMPKAVDLEDPTPEAGSPTSGPRRM